MEEGCRRRRKAAGLDYYAASSSRRLKTTNPADDDVRSGDGNAALTSPAAGHRRASSTSLEDLPEELLHKVISGLTVKEAGRTSVVSSRWRTRWIHHSNLCFDGTSSDSELAGYDGDRFVDHVATVLQRHSRIGVDRFELRSPLLGGDHARHLDRWWLGFAAAVKAKHVAIDLTPLKCPFITIDYSGLASQYRLPWPSSASTESIVSLLLGHVCLQEQGLVPPPPSAPSSNLHLFQSLKKLELKFVFDLGGLTPMLSGCPALEWLSICGSRIGHLVVPEKARCLRYLRLDLDSGGVVESIQLNSASLTTFEFTGARPSVPIKPHHAIKLSKATVLRRNCDTLCYFWDQLSSCFSAVHRLVLSFGMDRKTTTRLATDRTKFSHLRHLSLLCCHSFGDPDSALVVLRLTQILESAPQLEHFELHMETSRPYGSSFLKTAGDECIQPQVHHCLKTVQMTGVVGLLGQLELAKYILLSAHALQCMTLDIARTTRYPRESRSPQESLGLGMYYTRFAGLEKAAKEYLDPQGVYRHVLKIVGPYWYLFSIYRKKFER